MTGIADLVAAGKEFGIFQFYLPFIMLFAIVYGLLQKSKIFGPKAKGINIIIALAASFFVMEYALSAYLEVFFATFFAQTLGIFVGILGFLMITWLLLALVGEDYKPDAKKYVKYLVLIGAILAIATYISSGGTAIFPGFVIEPGFVIPIEISGLTVYQIGIIIVVLLTILAIWYMTREKEETKKGGYRLPGP